MLARGRRVVPVGRLAHAALGGRYIRHPSHGGAAGFRAGLLEYVRADRRRDLASERLPVARNTILLAASLAAMSGMLQLGAAIATLTFVAVTGLDVLLGLAPAILLATAAVAAVFAGRTMDRIGRIPVLAAGYLVGLAGAGLAALGVWADSTVALVAGLLFVGAANGVLFLTRTAAGDMYPPERRARGISFVLFGAVFGAILGPAVFAPLFSGQDVSTDTLALAWLAGGGFLVVGLVLVLLVRPDPKRIAERIAPPTDGPAVPAAPLREIVRRPGVIPAMLAALASFGVMVSVMNLTGYFVVEEHGHAQSDVFPIIGAHVLGMYALVLVVGSLIDRIGRTPSLAGRPRDHGRVVCRPRVGRERARDRCPSLRARPRVEPFVRRRHGPARRPRRARSSAASCSGSTTSSRAASARRSRSSGASRSRVSVSPPWRSEPTAIALAPVLWITRRGGRRNEALATIADR